MKRRRVVRRGRSTSNVGRPSTPRSRTFRIVASLLVFVVVMGGLELAARQLAPSVPTWQGADNDGVIMTGHETRLWGMGTGRRQNGDGWANINENGLRGPIPIVPRPADLQRILVLGDSTWFGHGVNDDQTTPAILERTLKAQGINVEVVNAAIPGYSTEQSKLILEELGWAMEPTLLLICNLWSDNNVDGFRDADLLRTNAIFRNNPLAYSSLFQLTAGWVDRARGGTGARIITWTKDSRWPENKERRVPLQDYARNLDWMVREAKSRGIGAAFVAPTNTGLVDGQFEQGAGWDPYFDVQKQVAEWHQLPLATAITALQGNATPTAEDFVDLMHPSPAGHEAIGMLIAAVLTEAGWPEKPLFGRDEAFDPSGLVDDGTLQAGGQPAKMSPQGQLFKNIIDNSSDSPVGKPGAGQTPDPAFDEAPPGAPGGDPSEPGGSSAGPPSDVPWNVFGTVAGGTGKITLVLTGADGTTISTSDANSAGEFSIDVPAAVASLTLTATDESGSSASGTALPGGSAMSLMLP